MPSRVTPAGPSGRWISRIAPAVVLVLGFLCFMPYPAISIGNQSALQSGNMLSLLLLIPAVALPWRYRPVFFYPLILMPLVLSAIKVAFSGNGDLNLCLKDITVWATACVTLVVIQLYAPRYALHLLTGIAAAMLLHALVGLWQLYSFTSQEFPFAGFYVNQSFLSVQDNARTIATYIQRPFGLFPEPSAMSSSLAPWVLFITAELCGVVQLRERPSRWRRILFAASAIGGLVLIILSGSGHTMITLAGLSVIGLLGLRKLRVTPRTVAIFLPTAGILLPLLVWMTVTIMANRIEGEYQMGGSWDDRSETLVAGFSMYAHGDLPTILFGLGAGLSADAIWNALRLDAVWSVLLTYIYETGLVGALAICLIGFYLLRVWRKQFQSGVCGNHDCLDSGYHLNHQLHAAPADLGRARLAHGLAGDLHFARSAPGAEVHSAVGSARRLHSPAPSGMVVAAGCFKRSGFPMNKSITFVVNTLTHGGAEIQVSRLANGFQRRGWRVAVVSMLPPVALDTQLREAGIEVFCLNMTPGVPNPLAILKLSKFIRDRAPQVVHSHIVHANLLARVSRLFAKMPVLVCTAHSLKEGCWVHDLGYRYTDRLADLTTNVSQAAVDRYVRLGLAPAGRIRFMPNGVDLTRFQRNGSQRARLRQQLGLESRFVWLAVARMEPDKDHANLFRAFAAVAANHPADPLLLLVGQGELESELRQLVDNLKLSRCVRFMGVRDDVADLMNAADAQVLSSSMEGMPLVLQEASATGLPIVATDVGGNAEVVIHESSGLIVPPRDSPALADAMCSVMKMTAEQRDAMGRRGRDHVESNFNIDRVLDRWEGIYGELLKAGPAVASRQILQATTKGM